MRTDKGFTLAEEMLSWLHNNNVIFPSVDVIERTLVNATMFDRYLPFSCPLNTFVTDAVRFAPFHHH